MSRAFKFGLVAGSVSATNLMTNDTASVALEINGTNATNSMSNDTTSVQPVITIDLNGTDYLAPVSNSSCPFTCHTYYAGASANDPTICYKQGSGVGTYQQNKENGVSCYPSYACGDDMVMCNQVEHVPEMFDHHLVCEEIKTLEAENPWECGAHGRPDCVHEPTSLGRWMKATADLDCGWGANYGNVGPEIPVDDRPASSWYPMAVASQVDGDYECCKKAMLFQNETKETGGRAVFFQFMADDDDNVASGTCRVDRENIVKSNLGSSSGYSTRFQNTRCGDHKFYYRHAAGAAEASNLHQGGRCAAGFIRLDTQLGPRNGVNLPRGELPDGWELPDHNCAIQDDEFGTACDGAIRFNTINDAAECCEMCDSLSWIGHPNIGGNANIEENPCIAWQIVQGKCRIVRKNYWLMHNYNHRSVEEMLLDRTYEYQAGDGNSAWMVADRNCDNGWDNEGEAPEYCNYYSFIHFREALNMTFETTTTTTTTTSKYLRGNNTFIGTPTNTSARDAPVAGFNATNQKFLQVGGEVLGLDDVTFTANVSYIGARTGYFEAHEVPACEDINMDTISAGNASCGQLEVYAEEQFELIDGYYVTKDGEQPLAASTCGCGILSVSVPASARRLKGRELAANDDYVVSFTSRGSGKDDVDFRNIQLLGMPPVVTIIQASTEDIESVEESETTDETESESNVVDDDSNFLVGDLHDDSTESSDAHVDEDEVLSEAGALILLGVIMMNL